MKLARLSTFLALPVVSPRVKRILKLTLAMALPFFGLGSFCGCATQAPLTLRAFPAVLVNAQTVHFTAKYTGVTQPASIEWVLCRTKLSHEADMALTRPLMWEISDWCRGDEWPLVRLRDASGRVIAEMPLGRPLAPAREDAR